MRFKDIAGHSSLKQKLANIADSSRVSHAMLFNGGEGYGALPLAVAYARYLNCTSRTEGDSCGKCPSCLKMNSLMHPDVHYVYPVNKSKAASAAGGVEGDKPVSDHFVALWREMFTESGGYFSEAMWYRKIEIENKQGNISRFEAAEVIRKLSFKAFESSYKVVIMWLPERMNEQASNALLKIIEEPWDKTVFILVSESPEQLLTTIISRTQEVSVPGISTDDITAWLIANKSLSPSNAQKIGRLSFGSVIEAERLCCGGDNEEKDDFEMFVSLMRLAFEDKHLQLLELAESAASMGREAQKKMLGNVLRLLRNSYMLSMGVDGVSYLHGEEDAFCRRFAPYVNNRNIEALVRETELLTEHIARNANPKIAFTHYVLTVSKLIVKI